MCLDTNSRYALPRLEIAIHLRLRTCAHNSDFVSHQVSRSDRLRAGPAQDRAAMASISTPAPSGRAATPKAARAGRVSPVK